VKRFFAPILGLLLGSQAAEAKEDRSVAGENDHWMLFERSTSAGLPLIVFARTGNTTIKRALYESSLTQIVCSAADDLIGPNRMPELSSRVYALEDFLGAEKSISKAQAFHIASITGDGARRIIYAHKRPIDFDAILKAFPVEGYTCSASKIADRSATASMVTPTALEIQIDGDGSVIANLEKSGDSGSSPRKTDFWFYGEKAALQATLTDLAAAGFTLDHWLEKPVGVVLTQVMPVDLATFKTLTPKILEIAERHHVEYDGWETFVVQPNPNQTPSAEKKNDAQTH
jgi:hypothetical protein